jgi:hypothetical protein
MCRVTSSHGRNRKGGIGLRSARQLGGSLGRCVACRLRTRQMQKNLRAKRGAFVTVVATLAAVCTLPNPQRPTCPILTQPSESGSISSGHQIAITICGNCHEDPASARKTTIGPKLEDIANRPTTMALSLKRISWFKAQNKYAEFHSLQGRYR